MKKAFMLAIVLFILGLLTATPMSTFAEGRGFLSNLKNEQPEENADNDYEVPQKQLVLKEEKIISPLFGTAVGRVVVPEGWNVTVEDFGLNPLSIYWPNAVVVTVSSPDGSCELIYVSKRVFAQTYDNLYGFEIWSEDNLYELDSLTHYLDYRMADECCVYMLQSVYGDDDYRFVKEYDFSDEEKANLHNAMDQYAKSVEDAFQTFVDAGIDVGQLLSTESSATKRQFRNNGGEFMVLAYSCGFLMRNEFLNSVSDRLIWEMPAIYIMRADSVAEYEELFDVFSTVTTVSKEYCEMCSRNGNRLAEEYTRILNSGGGFTTNRHDGYDDIEEDTIDSGDTYSAVDAWDDYIRGDTDYVTGSGDHVKISNDFDHVYELDDNIIIATNTTNEPGGGIELNPTQIGY